jgi:hypothetical protein
VTTTLDFLTKKWCTFGVEKFNSKHEWPFYKTRRRRQHRTMECHCGRWWAHSIAQPWFVVFLTCTRLTGPGTPSIHRRDRKLFTIWWVFFNTFHGVSVDVPHIVLVRSFFHNLLCSLTHSWSVFKSNSPSPKLTCSVTGSPSVRILATVSNDHRNRPYWRLWAMTHVLFESALVNYVVLHLLHPTIHSLDSALMRFRAFT